ncbi:PASTA domain-containing protein [Burkholderia sp. Ac-20379]|uniref:PASTA domain-containing protein n=1 Tax=Burkholderia sp. Ac-20379 TaxID=2703900 RepID=UPI00197F0D0E|nr:PASTA domain-containing protein [Burkholderia sp. Ac-20379]MBN3723156.1 hypothetical protein [Burkholderia sp. Ac-20379]
MVACTSILFAIAPPASAQVRVHSEVAGTSLVELSALPRSPETAPVPEFCAHYRLDATALSPAGRAVEALGWYAMSDAPLGRYRVVSFASGFEPGTSGICMPRHTNLGIFDGKKLVALAYLAHASQWQFGTLDPLETGGLLISEGEQVGGPVAELHQQDEGLALTDVAASRTFCGGRAIVPNVFGKSIAAARKILIAAGWQPVRPDEKPGPDDAAAGLAKHGVIEAETCSGTGVGYCGYTYRNASAYLSVVTVGGDPDPRNDNVVSAQAGCEKARAQPSH